MVCHNCHSEIHGGVTVVPDDAPKFNEIFADYKALERANRNTMDPCPMCGVLKPTHLKNCSHQCAGKSLYRVDWDCVDLVKELQTKSAVQLAGELGCSDAAIHKRLKKLGLK
jgi:hypothetical protein